MSGAVSAPTSKTMAASDIASMRAEYKGRLVS